MKKFLSLMAILATVFLISLVVAVPKSGSVYVELGDRVPSAPSDYLFGMGFMIKNADIDVSGVDEDTIGDYKVYAKYLFYSYTIDVEVGDRTGPVIVTPSDTVYVAAERDYAPADLVEEIYDLSGEVYSTVNYNGEDYDSIRFEDTGDYTAVIHAEDVWGNRSSREISFTVDDAPVIIGAFDRHIAVGSDFELDGVVAADSADGILTDRLQIDTGDFDAGRVGDYPITYTVSDNYGLETSETVTVSVCEKKQLSQYDEAFMLTDQELDLLCSCGYFAYEPLEEENYDEAVSLVEPTLVNLKRFWSNGAWAAGSGTIYKITPAYVYLISVEHVTKEVGENCRIMFFDGEVLRGSLDYVTSEKQNEMVMFTIETADIPADTLLRLRQVYVDTGIYDKLEVGDKVVGYAKHWNGTNQDLIRPMTVRAMTSSIKDFNFIDSLLETSQNVTNGMSGTAVVDYKGNLVGLASAAGPASTRGSGNSAYHSKIDVLDELYTKLNDNLT